ncbi:MAG TPA: hypothetical protein VF192_00285 [Longimicrobiales bacterium]
MLASRDTRFLLPALGALLVLAPSTAARAQGGGGEAEARARMGAAPLLLIETTGGELIRGRPVGWVDDWILLRDGRRIALGEIARAEALRPRTGEGARWGAVAGAAAGTGVLLASSGEGGASAAEGVLYVSGGALLGAAAGALWGSQLHRRELIYSASPADAPAQQTGLIEHRLGGGPGAVRTRLAITPFVGIGSHGARTTTSDGDEVGITSSQEVGLQLQYALGPRSVVRLAGSAIRTAVELEFGGSRTILDDRIWLARAELGLELRMRSNVPGYLVLAADAFYNPHGYVPVLDLESGQLEPDGIDAGVIPRIGAGVGLDFFTAGDRRVRIEGIYRVGRYTAPEVEARGFDPTRITQDATLTVGLHLPLVRPAPER